MTIDERRNFARRGALIEETIEIARRGRHNGILRLEDDLTIEIVDLHRKDEDEKGKNLCRHYEGCLTFVATLGWRSFSCMFCDGSNPHWLDLAIEDGV